MAIADSAVMTNFTRGVGHDAVQAVPGNATSAGPDRASTAPRIWCGILGMERLAVTGGLADLTMH